MPLRIGCESFFVDIGMYGNELGLNVDYFAVLATYGTWFKNVWELLHEFNTNSTFG